MPPQAHDPDGNGEKAGRAMQIGALHENVHRPAQPRVPAHVPQRPPPRA